jgi:hypothetical protein
MWTGCTKPRNFYQYGITCILETQPWDLHSFGILRCVKSQRSADLIYIMAEAWNHANSSMYKVSFLPLVLHFLVLIILMYKNIFCSHNHKQSQNISMLPEIKCSVWFPFLCHFCFTYASQSVADGNVWDRPREGGYLSNPKNAKCYHQISGLY